MDPVTIIAIITAVASLIKVIPDLQKLIQDSSMPDETKEQLLARIEEAKKSVQEWV